MRSRLVFAAVLMLYGCTAETTITEQSVMECGVERWLVKNLADSDTASVDFLSINSTVTEQAMLPRVSVGSNEKRRADERQTFRINCRLIEYKLEPDGDIHLVLQDLQTDSTMVAEIPNPECPEVKATSRYVHYAIARSWMESRFGKLATKFTPANQEVTIIGVGYYDRNHGQRGKAYNNREIHPVMSIH